MIDIDDDDAVLEDMADALDVDVEDLSIEPRSNTSVEVSLGSNTFTVWESEEAAAEEILAEVKERLESEPESFTQSWLRGHIDLEKLRELIHEIAMEDTYAQDISDDPERFWDEAQNFEVDDLPEPDEDGEMPQKIKQKYIDALQEKRAEADSQDPWGYLSNMYDDKEAAEWAIKHAGIDIDKAADEAVSTDGWQNFAGSYDGNSYETAHDLVYVQTGGTGNKGRSSSIPRHMRPPKF